MTKKRKTPHDREQESLDDGSDLRRSRRRTSVEKFKHAPLSAPQDYIRLFVLQISPQGGLLSLDLWTYKFADCPEYTAISYVWGNLADTISIKVNSKPLEITKNAFYALRQVSRQAAQDKLSTKLLWMDSICIDQENLSEKGHQVQLMGNIFANAEEVLSCIGPHADHSDLVIDVFEGKRILSQWYHLLENASHPYRSRTLAEAVTVVLAETPKRHNDKITPSLVSICEFEDAVARFCDREYWHRIWIVQEVRSARAVKLLCGSDVLQLSEITEFSDLSPVMTPEPGLTWLKQWSKSSLGVVIGGFVGRTVRKKYHAELAFRDLYESKCSDFRDRVYALLRLMVWDDSGKSINIQPDYQITKLGLIVQVLEDIASSECSGASVWAIMSSLYRTLRLEATDPEISRLIMRRQQNSAESGLDASDEQGPIIECRSGLGMSNAFLLDECEGALRVPCSSRPFQRSGTPPTNLVGLKGQCQKLMFDNEHAGWLCPQALPGDYLVPAALNVTDPLGAPDLIVRKDDSHFGRFKIIGHAVVYHQLLTSSKGLVLSLLFDIEDYIALVALRNNAVRDDITAEDLVELLNTSPTSAERSSYATRRDEGTDERTGSTHSSSRHSVIFARRPTKSNALVAP